MKLYRIIDTSYTGKLAVASGWNVVQKQGILFGWNDVARFGREIDAIDFIKEQGGHCVGVFNNPRYYD